MIVAGRVTVIDRYGVVVEEDARPVTLQVDGTPGRVHHLIVEFGDHRAVAVDLAAVRRVVWLGRRQREIGALLEADRGRLRLIDATVVDLTPVAGIHDGMLGALRVWAGRYEIELALDDVMTVLVAPAFAAVFGEPVKITRH